MEAAEPPDDDHLVPNRASSEWILVVDDDSVIRESARDVLDGEGYIVASAPNAKSARAKLELERFSCIILDLGPPDGSAELLLTELAAHPNAPAVIVVSAAANLAEVGRHYGVLHLAKPFELDVLLAAVKVAVSQEMRPFLRSGREATTVRLRPAR